MNDPSGGLDDAFATGGATGALATTGAGGAAGAATTGGEAGVGAGAGAGMDASVDADSSDSRRAFTRSPNALRANAATVDAGASFRPAALRSSAAMTAAVGHRESGAAESAFAATSTSPFAHGAPSGTVAAGRGPERTRRAFASPSGPVSSGLPLSASHSSTPAAKTSARAS